MIEKEEQFVEGLLLKACSFTVEMLERNPRDFVDFLDATSRLRSIDLRDLDLSSDAALCLVLNLYHCLLQHSLLLSIEGPPSKKSVGHFKRVSCYEIGNDVFSLAELECCLLRGRMNRPTNPRSPYIEAPKASQTAYRHYALTRAWGWAKRKAEGLGAARHRAKLRCIPPGHAAGIGLGIGIGLG